MTAPADKLAHVAQLLYFGRCRNRMNTNGVLVGAASDLRQLWLPVAKRVELFPRWIFTVFVPYCFGGSWRSSSRVHFMVAVSAKWRVGRDFYRCGHGGANPTMRCMPGVISIAVSGWDDPCRGLGSV